MISSEEALSFFNEWRNLRTRLSVNATFGEATIGGEGIIASLDRETLWLTEPNTGFSLHLSLTNCEFNSFDPERGSGDPSFDGPIREFGFRFSWEIVVPSGGRVLLSEIDKGHFNS